MSNLSINDGCTIVLHDTGYNTGDFARAWNLPYRKLDDGSILVTGQDYREYGWDIAWPLPLENGVVVIDYFETGFRIPTQLPYTHANANGHLEVTIVDSRYGFYPAVAVNRFAQVLPYSTDVLETLGAPIPGDELVFGLELESKELTLSTLEALSGRKCIFKSDVSCGVELVTQPMTYKELTDWVEAMPLHLLQPNDKCGMHLHINRKYLTQREACALAMLISDEDHEGAINLRAGRPPNQYCKKAKKGELLEDRYQAVNLTNFGETKNTVEIRIFAGTNSKTEIQARLRWVMSLLIFVKSEYCSGSYSDFLSYWS